MAKKQTANTKPRENDFVMVCPKCKSTDIMPDRSSPVQPALGLPEMFICNTCGHSGYAFPEVEAGEVPVFEKEAKEHNLIDTKKDETPLADTSYGNFEVHIMWKITAPVTLLLGVLFMLRWPPIGIALMATGIFTGYIAYVKKKGKR